MEFADLDALKALKFLFAGLLAAWVYYGLSGEKKPATPERVVQAVIFTFVVKALVSAEHSMALLIGRHFFSISEWTQSVETFWTAATAIALGMGVAHPTPRQRIFEWLRKRNLTKLTGHFGEWRRAFDDGARYVVLQFKDGRRLYGFPREYPVDPERGHFRVETAAWLPTADDAKPVELTGVRFMIVSASEVRWVEFTPLDSEVDDDKLRGAYTQQLPDFPAAAGADPQGRDKRSDAAGSATTTTASASAAP